MNVGIGLRCFGEVDIGFSFFSEREIGFLCVCERGIGFSCFVVERSSYGIPLHATHGRR